MPTEPPEPTATASVISNTLPANGVAWHAVGGYTDPDTGAALGHFTDRSGAIVHLINDGVNGLGTAQWTATTSPGTNTWGLLFSQGDANKIQASGASINSSGQLVSGGNTYTLKQITVDDGSNGARVLLRLV